MIFTSNLLENIFSRSYHTGRCPQGTTTPPSHPFPPDLIHKCESTGLRYAVWHGLLLKSHPLIKPFDPTLWHLASRVVAPQSEHDMVCALEVQSLRQCGMELVRTTSEPRNSGVRLSRHTHSLSIILSFTVHALVHADNMATTAYMSTILFSLSSYLRLHPKILRLLYCSCTSYLSAPSRCISTASY
jgi:hypothetical protein